MKTNKFRLITSALIALNIGSAPAAIIDNGNFTTDTYTGLDWLDLSETAGLTYDSVTSSVQFDGWRYATISEVSGFFDAFGGDSSDYISGWSSLNNGLFDRIAPLWGDLHSSGTAQSPGDGWSHYIIGPQLSGDRHLYGTIGDDIADPLSASQDYISIYESIIPDDTIASDYASALIRMHHTGNVPEPTILALLSVGLLGAMRLNRRRGL